MSRYTVLNTIDRVLSSAVIDMSASISILIESNEIKNEVAKLKSLGMKDMLKINALQTRLAAHESAIANAIQNLDNIMRHMHSGSNVYNEEYVKLYNYSDAATICKQELEQLKQKTMPTSHSPRRWWLWRKNPPS